jgi:hypothetical protein
MRPVIVVMVLVLTKHGCGMPLVGDEDAVEQFAAVSGSRTRIYPLTCRLGCALVLVD